MGRKHYDEANKLADLDIFEDKTSDITPKDYVENIVEVFFLEHFRQNWIGGCYGGGNGVLVPT